MSHDHDQRLDPVRALPFHRFLGVENLRADGGEGRLELTVGETSANPSGYLHGGVAYALCDVACYAALLSLLAPEQDAVTHDLHVSVMHPVQQGRQVVFSGRVVRMGKRLAFLEASAEADGVLIASARVTKSIVGGK